jgi:hypothetical protein
MFMAGARVKKGLSYGATDELGVVGRGGRMHINVLHDSAGTDGQLSCLSPANSCLCAHRFISRPFAVVDVARNCVELHSRPYGASS